MMEIERKFLVRNFEFLSGQGCHGFLIKQAYLLTSSDRSLRIRLKHQRAFLTLKIGLNPLERSEFEYEIPIADAEELLATCSKVLSKVRYEIMHKGTLWEVDLFQEGLSGLCIAEVELESSSQIVELPDWVGEEVTHDPQYLNVNLIKRLEVR